jgi:hypothetical protein
MNAGIDVPQIQRFGALYIASARLKSMSKWKAIIAAVDIGNPLFYLIAVGVGIGVLVEQGSGTSGTNGTTGTSGTSGTSGTTGSSGTSGFLNLTGSTNNGIITYNGFGGDVQSNFKVQSGYVILNQVSSSLNFLDDAAAAAAGVPLGGLYRNGNFILIRIT